MSDEKLIRAIAELWVEGGGDSEGLDWSIEKIKKEVDQLLTAH